MIVLKAETLESQGIVYNTSSKIIFNNKLFTKGLSFSKRLYQQVVATLEEDDLKNRTVYLVVDFGNYFTVWHKVEKPTSTKVSSKRLNQQISAKGQSPLSQVEPADETADTELRLKIENIEDKEDIEDKGETTLPMKATECETQATIAEKPKNTLSDADDVIEIQMSYQGTVEQVSSSETGLESQTDSAPTIKLKYRGVTVNLPPSDFLLSDTEKSAEESSLQQKYPRKYRGKSY